MAIQKIDLTVPGGDTPRSANTKINANFSNTDHAASRLVGTQAGNVMAVGAFGLGQEGFNNQPPSPPKWVSRTGFYKAGTYRMCVLMNWNTSTVDGSTTGIATDANGGLETVAWKANVAEPVFSTVYTSRNTTKDAGTGFLKVSSPILHVYNDKIDKIHEAEQLDITVDKKGVGHYEIHGTTGLRQNDGWNMSPPRDIHGNVRCMIEVTEKDGVIIVKTYKRKFDLELAAIVHDYDNPLDIPEGACVELRFNDLPQETPTDLEKTNL